MKITELAPDIVEFDSEQPGTTAILLCYLHGNEKGGEAVLLIWESLRNGEITLHTGKLILAIGNPVAKMANQRFIEVDGNRSYKEFILAGNSTEYEDQRARLITGICRSQGVRVAMDIHSVNKPSEPFAAFQNYAERLFCRHFAVDKVTIDPDNIMAGEVATFDGWCQTHGIQSVCYETGLASDVSRVQEVQAEILSVLGELKLVDRSYIRPYHNLQQEVFQLTHALHLTPAGWCWAEGTGTHSFQPVAAGQVLGYAGDEPIISQRAGVILWPKVESLWSVGAPVGFLASPPVCPLERECMSGQRGGQECCGCAAGEPPWWPSD